MINEAVNISIIMPVYNSSLFLNEALDSIINSTYSNWELLIVDDGSTDESVSICQSYAQSDNRIQVYTLEHNGVSTARNYGISQSTGKYIFFVDSDDVIHPRLIDTLYSLAKEHSASFVTEYFERFYEGIVPSHSIEDSSDNIRIFSNTNLTFYFDEFGQLGRIGGALVKRELALRGFNPQYFRGEDSLFVLQTLQDSETIILLAEKWYYYRIHGQNATSNKDNHNTFNQVKCYVEMASIFGRIPQKNAERMCKMMAISNFSKAFRKAHEEHDDDFLTELFNYGNDTMYPIIRTLSPYQRMKLFANYHMHDFYQIIRRVKRTALGQPV